MRYFDGIEWVIHGHLPECRALVDKSFDSYYLLAYAHQGEVELSIDHGAAASMTFAGPAAWLCFPGPHFRFGTRGAPWEHRYVGFRGPRAKAFLKSELFRAGEHPPVFPIIQSQNFSRRFDELLASIEAGPGNPRSVLILEDLLLQLHEQTALKKSDPFRECWERFREKPELDWDFADEARKLGLSFPHFRKSFTRVVGEPPGRALIRARMDRAATLLGSGPLKVGEVARLVGIDDLFYFSRLFKKYRRVSPEAFRREARLFSE
ncbi:MAG: helix-turn-helix transcriptional regulator [Spirochaetia bacterium]|nr:helix-turn-helix transcriptional regulator [Spirochaetia bacterium]